MSKEEIDDSIWAAAAPVTDGRNVVASLSAPCPAFRLDKNKRETIIDLVRKTVADISHALGTDPTAAVSWRSPMPMTPVGGDRRSRQESSRVAASTAVSNPGKRCSSSVSRSSL